MYTSGDYRFYMYRYTNYHHTDMTGGVNMHYLAILLKGNAKIKTDTQTLYIHTGDVFYIPRGLRYQSYWYGEPQVEFLSLGFLTMPVRDHRDYLLQTISDNQELRSLMERIPIQGSFVSSYALSLFYAALAIAVAQMEHGPDSLASGIVERAMDYIRSHPFAQVPAVAKACGVSQPHLYSLFRNVTKLSPNQYRQNILCERAMELLTTTDQTVQQISEELHFSSPSYFRKVFFQHTGMTPREFRQQKEQETVGG